MAEALKMLFGKCFFNRDLFDLFFLSLYLRDFFPLNQEGVIVKGHTACFNSQLLLLLL